MCIMNKQYTYIYCEVDLFFFDSEAEVNKFRDHCLWLLPRPDSSLPRDQKGDLTWRPLSCKHNIQPALPGRSECL